MKALAVCFFAFVVGLLCGRGFLAGSKDAILPSKIDSRSIQSARDRAVEDKLNQETKLALMEQQVRFDQGIAFPEMDTTFTAFSNGWEISDKLADALKLSDEDRQISQGLINETKLRFEQLVKENSSYVEELSKPDQNIVGYRIQPFMQSGHAELERLHFSLRNALPVDVGDELFNYVRWRHQLGAYGANEVEVIFQNLGGGGDNAFASFLRRNSMTGAVISAYNCSLQELLDHEGLKISMIEK